MTSAEPFSFRHPSSILVAGPSGCGKTVFTTKLLLENSDLFPHTPSNVHYCYGIWQDNFKVLKDAGVNFHEGIPLEATLKKWFPQGGLLILDDLMTEGSKDKSVLDLFTKISHHQGITVIYLTQDLFPPGKYAKTISRNAHYVIAFKNPRNQLGIKNLLLQAYPNKWQPVLDVFTLATSRPHGYMLLDLHPASNDDRRIISRLLKSEGFMRCYQWLPSA